MNKFLNKKSVLSLALAMSLGFVGCNSSSNKTMPAATETSVDVDSSNFTVQDISELYIATYNKPPTYKIITELMGTYHSLREAARNMHPDPARYPADQSYDDFVETLYRTIYGRASTESEKKVWVDKLYNGEILKQDMWMEFENAATGEDRKVIDNKVEVARYYADQHKGEDYLLLYVTADPSTVITAKREIDNLKDLDEISPEATLLLTANEDHITGTAGFDVIEGRVVNGNMETLQSIDTVYGGGGRDVLRATVIQGSAPTIKEIEELEVRFAGDDDKAVLDLINTDDIEVIKINESAQIGTIDNIFGIYNFEFIATNNNITLDHGVAKTLNLTTTLVGTPKIEVDLNFKKSPTEVLKIKSTNSYFIYDQNDTKSTVLSAGIDVTGENIIRLEGGKDTLSKIILTGTGNINLAPGNGSMMNQFMLSAVSHLEADDSVGDVKFYLDNHDAATLKYVKTVGGIDEIFIYADDERLQDDLKIELGAGDDIFIIMAESADMIPTTITVDAEGGLENKLGMNSDVATTLEDGKQEVGFENFGVFIIIDDLDGTVDMNAMNDIPVVVLYKKYKDHSEIRGLENKAFITFMHDIDDDDGDTTITLKGDTTIDSTVDRYNINFMAPADTDFGDIVMNYVENLNFLTNDGGIKKAAIVDGSAEHITVSGNAILDIFEKPLRTVQKVNIGDAGASVNISGDGDVQQEVISGAGNDKIALGDGDGENINFCSVGRGNDEVFGGAGEDEINLGSGNDIVHSSGGMDKITLGTGADLYIAHNTQDSSGTKIDKIKDFNADEDLIDFSEIVAAALGDDGELNYIGEVENSSDVTSALTKDDNVAEIVLAMDNHKVYIDVNDDGDITKEDMILDLSANQVDNLSKGNFVVRK